VIVVVMVEVVLVVAAAALGCDVFLRQISTYILIFEKILLLN
jgi:hypothetical protein